MTKSRLFISIVFMSVMSMLSCTQKQQDPKINESRRAEIIEELNSMQDQLPSTIPGTEFTICDVEIEDDEFLYTVSVPIDFWRQQGLSQADANSDKNIARVLSNFNEELVQQLIDAHLGFKYIYIAEHNDSTLMTMTLSADKMGDVLKRLKDGTLEPYTMTELAQLELSKMDIPQQIEEGVWLTDVYVKDGDVYYEITIEAELEPEDMDAEILAGIKQDIITELRSDPTFCQNRKQIERENTHYIYIYKDNRGIKVATVNISAKDIFGNSSR